MNTNDTDALEVGRRIAEETLRFRKRALSQRARAQKEEGFFIEIEGEPAFEERLLKAVGGLSSAGLLIAEGDSWFALPGRNLLKSLRDDFAYSVCHVAGSGDRLEEMAYEPGQLTEFTSVIEEAIRLGRMPQAILLSGGGNDMVGERLDGLLHHARSADRGLNHEAVETHMKRMRAALIVIIEAISKVCQARLACKVPVLVHGYEYPIPDGRSMCWLVGPWLLPAFKRRGYHDADERQVLARELTDRFNEMLADIVGVSCFEHVRFVDLRGSFPIPSEPHTDWWGDELHPNQKGYRRLAERLDEEIQALM